MPGRRSVVAAAAAAGLAAGCDPVIRRVSRALGADLPDAIATPRGAARSAARHLLHRAAFGPWPGQVERVEAMGAGAWIEAQLHPDRIDDRACDLRAELLDVALVPDDLIFELRPEDVRRQLVAHTALRAVYSERQLLEVLVGFWADHFHVAIQKDDCQHLLALHLRGVIRPRALGRFRDLLRAVVLSPAMLVYLDGRENRAGAPNENYARELLELHTLGVGAGYGQDDVMEAARCLTGWTVTERGAPGRVRFDPARHDDGAKNVLGRLVPAGGGPRDLDRLLDVVVAHPACARFVTGRLCEHFVAAPSDALRREAERAWRASGGTIRDVVRAILTSAELAADAEAKVARPFRFVATALRALGADTHARGALAEHLARMGHALFEHPTPDGPPRAGDAYLGTTMGRWRFALALTDDALDDTRVDLGRLRRALGEGDPVALAFEHLVGRAPRASERAPLDGYLAAGGAPDRVFALTLSSPAFLRC